MNKKLDLVVIGTGTAASTVASQCRAAGWEVAVVDARPFGGTCALRGCDPKKVLVGAADVTDWARRMKGKGIRPGGQGIDWPELMRFKRTFTEPVPKRIEENFTRAGVAAFHGRARFVGPTAVRVGDETLEARAVVVAAGQKPAPLKIPGAESLATSDQFLELDALPPRVIFVGGGYISFEFAHVAARAGARVTILHQYERPLERFDPDLVDRLVKYTRELGIDVQLQAKVEGVEKNSGGFIVRASRNGETLNFEGDLAVHGAGRVAEIEDLGLDAAGVQWSPRGVHVNEFLQSISNPAVYAAGDAAASDGPPLTPVAGYEGQIVAENLLRGNRRIPNYVGIATVVYTIPPLASVGLPEAAAQKQGLRFRTKAADTASWYSSRRIGETCSGFKVLVEEGSGRILGAHLLGSHADETINVFALAMRQGIPAAAVQETVFAYPTNASDIKYML